MSIIEDNALPFISVIILTFNAGQTLRSCLKSIFDQEYRKDLLEVLLVDGGSTDNTIGIAKEFPTRIIQMKASRGQSRNIAVQNAKGDVVAMVDADVVIPGDWLKKMAKIFKDPKINVVSVPYITPMPHLDFVGQVIYYITSGWQAHYRKADG